MIQWRLVRVISITSIVVRNIFSYSNLTTLVIYCTSPSLVTNGMGVKQLDLTADKITQWPIRDINKYKFSHKSSLFVRGCHDSSHLTTRPFTTDRFVSFAESQDVLVTVSLWAGARMENQKVVDMVRDADRTQSFIDNALMPLVEALAAHNGVSAWEVSLAMWLEWLKSSQELTRLYIQGHKRARGQCAHRSWQWTVLWHLQSVRDGRWLDRRGIGHEGHAAVHKPGRVAIPYTQSGFWVNLGPKLRIHLIEKWLGHFFGAMFWEYVAHDSFSNDISAKTNTNFQEN